MSSGLKEAGAALICYEALFNDKQEFESLIMSTHQSKNPLEQIEDNDCINTPQRVPGLFSKQECHQIIELSNKLPLKERVIGEGESSRVDLYTRSSRVKWMGVAPDNQWVFERIRDAINQVNQLYKFEILGCTYLQVTEYPVGGHFNWHEDIGSGETSKRKLSLTVQLSDPAEYNGGDLEFLNSKASDKVRDEHRQQGTAQVIV